MTRNSWCLSALYISNVLRAKSLWESSLDNLLTAHKRIISFFQLRNHLFKTLGQLFAGFDLSLELLFRSEGLLGAVSTDLVHIGFSEAL